MANNDEDLSGARIYSILFGLARREAEAVWRSQLRGRGRGDEDESLPTPETITRRSRRHPSVRRINKSMPTSLFPAHRYMSSVHS